MFKFLSFFKNKNSIYEQNKNLILKKCSTRILHENDDAVISICSIMILPDDIVNTVDEHYNAPITVDSFINCVNFLEEFTPDIRKMTLKRLSDNSFCYWKELYENWEELIDMYWYLYNTPLKEYKIRKQREKSLEKRLLEILGIRYTNYYNYEDDIDEEIS